MSDAETTTKPVEEPQAEAIEAQKPAETAEITEAAKPEQPEQPEVTEEKKEKDTESGDKSGSQMLKTKGDIDYKNHKNNRKFDPSARAVSNDPDAIRKQVEFYFGDWNFPQDKFMWEQAGGSENKPVPVKTLHSFKRMRTFQPYSAVVDALRESSFLEVSGEEGDEVVKRKKPYQPLSSSRAKVEASTVYVKGFGDETPTTQFDLESFFSNFGEVRGLKLRRTNENFFKGSAFVTFDDEETAQKFIKTDPSPQWNGHDLKIMSKKDYCNEKSAMIRQGKIEPNSSNPKKFFEGRDGPRDRDDWKKRREHDQKNGFRDRRGGGRGRGGRGRGRGGRGGGRDHDRNGNGYRRDEEKSQNATPNDAKPSVQANENPDASSANSKRAREDDGPTDEPAAKKVDTKTETATES